MLILWPVISWVNQEMPIIVNRSWGPQSSCRLHRVSYTSIDYRTHSHASLHARSMACYFLVKPWMPIIVNRSWGPQSSCRLHRLSYIFACYPRISVVYFVCVTSSCLPKSFNLLIDVLSYVHVPTCPSFNPTSSLRAFEPSHHISPSLSYLPILTPISPLRSIVLYLSHLPVQYHHFNSSHYPSLSCSRLPVLRPDPSTGCTFWNVITLFDLLCRPVVNIMSSSARALIAQLSSKSMASLIQLRGFPSLIHLLYL